MVENTQFCEGRCRMLGIGIYIANVTDGAQWNCVIAGRCN